MRKYIMLVFAVTFLVITALPLHATIQDGLMLYFDFDESDGEIVTDLSAGAHDGILNGGADIIDDEVKIGTGALRIEDQTAVMEVESFTELEEYEDNTFIFWIHFIEASNGAWSQIIAKIGGGDRSPGIWINPGSTGIHYRYNPGNAGFGQIGPEGEGGAYETEIWYHIACTKDDGKLIFYVNGEQQGETNVPGSHSQGSGSLYVGKSQAYRAATFIMDDLAIYDRALEEDEVVEVMNGGLANTPVEAAGKLAATWGGVKNKY